MFLSSLNFIWLPPYSFMSSAGGNGMGVIVRLLGGWQGLVTMLLISSLISR